MTTLSFRIRFTEYLLSKKALRWECFWNFENRSTFVSNNDFVKELKISPKVKIKVPIIVFNILIKLAKCKLHFDIWENTQRKLTILSYTIEEITFPY